MRARRHSVEHAAQSLRGAKEPRGLHRHDQLGVLARRELRQRVKLQDRDQRGIRIRVGDRLIDGRHGLGRSLGFEDGRLSGALRPEDGGLPITFGGLDLRLPLAVGDVDGRLLLPLRLQDQRPLLLVGLLLQGQGIEDGLRRRDVDDLDPIDSDSPLVGYRLHLLLQLGIDPLPLAERLVEGHATEDGAECRARQLVDGDEIVANAEECKLRIDDLAEDGGVDADRDVVTGDDLLLVAGPRRLADVNEHHRVEERHQEGHAWLAHRMELAEALHDALVTLLDDVDGSGNDDDGEENENRADDQLCGHVSTSSQTVGVGWDDAARTIRTVLRSAVTITGVVAGRLLPSSVTAGHNSPAILTWPGSPAPRMGSSSTACWPTMLSAPDRSAGRPTCTRATAIGTMPAPWISSSTLTSPISSRPAGKSMPITDMAASQSGQLVALTASVGSQLRCAHAPQARQMRSKTIPLAAGTGVVSPPRST